VLGQSQEGQVGGDRSAEPRRIEPDRSIQVGESLAVLPGAIAGDAEDVEKGGLILPESAWFKWRSQLRGG
jgi:hypothetical protein